MKILIVSGFLGAGKTTFIKYLAKTINIEFIVLENEYAEIGVDGDLLAENNLKVWELSEGCICCSMQGDFKSSIEQIQQQINPEYLLIEPTGVGMLGQVIDNIKKLEKISDIELLNPITMLDVSCFTEYLKNFEDFFVDNIKNTGKVILTRTEQISFSELEKIKEILKNMNKEVEIISENYMNFGEEFFGNILNQNIRKEIIDNNFKVSTHINLRTFSQTNIKIETMDALGLFLSMLMEDEFGKVYRAKGIVKIENQWGRFDIVHKNFEMLPLENSKLAKSQESKIVIIGNNLDDNKIKEFLN